MNLLLFQLFLLAVTVSCLAGDKRYSTSQSSDTDNYDEEEDEQDGHQHSRAPLFLPGTGFGSGLLGGGAFGAPARTIIVPTQAAFTQPCCSCNSGFSNQGFSNQGFSQQIPAPSGPLLAGEWDSEFLSQKFSTFKSNWNLIQFKLKSNWNLNLIEKSEGRLTAAGTSAVNWPYLPQLQQLGYGQSPLGLGQQIIYSPLALSASSNERDGHNQDVTPSTLEGKRSRSRRFRNRNRGSTWIKHISVWTFFVSLKNKTKNIVLWSSRSCMLTFIPLLQT